MGGVKLSRGSMLHGVCVCVERSLVLRCQGVQFTCQLLLLRSLQTLTYARINSSGSNALTTVLCIQTTCQLSTVLCTHARTRTHTHCDRVLLIVFIFT